jgi:ATP-dependent RNA helicase RhlE
LSREITTLAGDILRDPQTVEAGERRNPAETVSQHFYQAEREAKMDLLLHVLKAERMSSVLVFTRTKHGADKVCRRLDRQGVAAVAIHSNRTQSQRERALEGFRHGDFRVLVATDIAARGIDVDGISHVINYDVPQYPEDYIHRIGRTGRAGATGDAVTFVSVEESQYLRKIEKYTGRRHTTEAYPGAPVPASPRPAEVKTVQQTGRQARPSFPHPVPKGKRSRKPVPPAFPRKRKPFGTLESFSSDNGGSGWSNY